MILYGEWMDKYKLTIYSLIISDNLLISFAYINDILSNNIFNIYIIMLFKVLIYCKGISLI